MAGTAGATGGAPAHRGLAFGPYLMEREVGRGRDSVVFRAQDPRDRSAVALKLPGIAPGTAPLAELAHALQEEADALRRVVHPNIVSVREVGVIDGRPYIVFPFVVGTPVDQAMAAGTLTRSDALLVMVKVADAVHYAHKRGLIHRDLKPSHILVGPDHEPHVLDFGLSWRAGRRAEPEMQNIVGTPAYMSPEQARGEEQRLTPAADVYALGAVLYELLAGRPPFSAETPWKTVQMVLSAAPVPPRRLDPTIPADCERVILWCLEKDPARRYRSAADLAEDLRRIVNGEKPRGPGRGGFLRWLFE